MEEDYICGKYSNCSPKLSLYTSSTHTSNNIISFAPTLYKFLWETKSAPKPNAPSYKTPRFTKRHAHRNHRSKCLALHSHELAPTEWAICNCLYAEEPSCSTESGLKCDQSSSASLCLSWSLYNSTLRGE